MSWANQLRLLTGAFEQLGSIVGGVLINAFKPFIQALNSVMGSVINFAQVVSDALGAIFGWEYQVGGGVTDDMAGAAVAAEDMADATGDAAKKAKELNRYIAAWHEVNNMTTDEGGRGSGGGGGAGGGGASGAGDAGQWVQTQSLWEKYTSEIDTLYKLGEYIGDTLTDAMNSIDWDSVYESARGFGTGLANFLNGLISPDLFGATGRTIAGSLNAAIYAALAFGETFNWKDLGISIAEGINEFFATYDLASWGRTISVWANGILDTIIEAIDHINWYEIGEKIGSYFENIDYAKILGKAAQAIWKALNSGLELYEGMFETAPFETALLSIVSLTKVLKTNQLQKFFGVISKNVKYVSSLASALAGNQTALSKLQSEFPKTSKVAEVLGDSIWNLKQGFTSGKWTEGVYYSFKNITENLSATQKGVIGAASAFGEFALVSDSVYDLVNGTGDLATNLIELASGAAVGAAGMVTAFGRGGVVIAAIEGVLAAFQGLSKAIREESGIQELSDDMDNLANTVSNNTETIKSNLESAREEMESAGLAESNMAKDLAAEYENLSGKTSLTAAEQERLKTVSSQLVELIPDLNKYIDDQTGYLDVQKDTLDDLIENMGLYAQQQAAQELLTDAYKQQISAQQNLTEAQDEYNSSLDAYLEKTDLTAEAIDGIKNGTLDLAEASEFWHTMGEAAFVEKYGVSLAGLSLIMQTVEEETSGAKKALEDASEAAKDAEENIEFLTEKNIELSGAIADVEEAEINSVKSSADFQQALRNINSEFNNMDLDISGKFAESLAFTSLDNPELVESITGMFDKLINQTELSAEELNTLFANIAPNMSQSFITAFAEQDPLIQAQIAATLGNISAGAKISSEEASQVFSSMGYEFPNEIVKGFIEQGPSVQQSTIDLLARVSAGEKLVSGNLLQLFDGLGHNVPMSMIMSMADLEPEAQQGTINLLNQIAAGYDFTAEDLLNRFEELGLELPSFLQNALESENENTREQAVELLEQLLNAEESERGEILERLFDLGTDSGKKGLVPGIDSQQDSVKTSGANLANKAPEGASSVDAPGQMENIGENTGSGFLGGLQRAWDTVTSWVSGAVNGLVGLFEGILDIGSPSRVLEKIGEYTIEGFNIGMENMMPEGYRSISEWINNIVNGASSLKIQAPQLDLSVDTSKYRFQPAKIDADKIQGEVRESLDYLFSEDAGIIDYDRLGEAVYQAQSQVARENPVKIGDDEIFRSTQRAQRREFRRTGKIGFAGI